MLSYLSISVNNAFPVGHSKANARENISKKCPIWPISDNIRGNREGPLTQRLPQKINELGGGGG